MQLRVVRTKRERAIIDLKVVPDVDEGEVESWAEKGLEVMGEAFLHTLVPGDVDVPWAFVDAAYEVEED